MAFSTNGKLKQFYPTETQTPFNTKLKRLFLETRRESSEILKISLQKEGSDNDDERVGLTITKMNNSQLNENPLILYFNE
jgi:hypothetical protein